MGYIKHNGKKYKSIRLRISRFTDFSQILEEFHHIVINGVNDKKLENIRYALLEIINNSVRAHKEKNENKEIILKMMLEEEELIIKISDHGGGFDKKMLPYDLDQNIKDIDINNQDFLKYRERYGFNRFGMGLFMTKKTFDAFILKFIESDGSLNDEFKEGRTIGTCIELRSNIKNENE
ncbi:ATP-binding protein [Oceanispirochaeta crateris]|uniref:ATP-binding protein n=1 Tax=Oceanispirochaeta crateris TaxID=2518645 RepID=A0A5C1QM47_9SPIO|nr:ATP-binding protein [Oceanispirochaeta crateris]QEN08050.1 ATP-binding protein [Oceanispirochaeta crateris]